MNLNPFSGGGMPGIPNLGNILGGGGGLPGLPGLLGMGGGQQQGQGGGGLGGTIQQSPYVGNDNSTGADGSGAWNLQSLLDMMNINQQSQGGTQSYIGGQGLI